jgi:predicted kinase
MYAAGWVERTYAECLRRAEGLLFEGERVLVDASFREEAQRRAFLEAAARWGVPGLFLLCQAEPGVVRERPAGRRDDASDADWSIHLKSAEAWEEPGCPTGSVLRAVPTGGTREQACDLALAVLRGEGLSA